VVDATACGTETINAYTAASLSANINLVCATGTNASPTAHLYQFPATFTGSIEMSLSHVYAATPTTNTAVLQLFYSASSTCASSAVIPITSYFIGSVVGGTNTMTFWYSGTSAYYLCFTFNNPDTVTVTLAGMFVIQTPFIALSDNSGNSVSVTNPLSINLQTIIQQNAQNGVGALNWANSNGQLIANVPNVVVTQSLASGTPTTPAPNIYNTGNIGPTTTVYYVNPNLGFAGGGASNVSFIGTTVSPGPANLPVLPMINAVYGNVLPHSSFFHWCTNTSGLFSSGQLFPAPNGTCAFTVAVTVTSSTTAILATSVGGIALNNLTLALTSLAGSGASNVYADYNDICSGAINYVFLNTTMGDGQTCITIDLALILGTTIPSFMTNVSDIDLGTPPSSGCALLNTNCYAVVNQNLSPTTVLTVPANTAATVNVYISSYGVASGGAGISILVAGNIVASVGLNADQGWLGPFSISVPSQTSAAAIQCQYNTAYYQNMDVWCNVDANYIGGSSDFAPYYATSYAGGPPQQYFYSLSSAPSSLEVFYKKWKLMTKNFDRDVDPSELEMKN